MQTIDVIKKVLKENNGIDESTITESSSFQDLGLDSLDTVDIVMKLEGEFPGIEIEANESLKTVGDLVSYIDSKK